MLHPLQRHPSPHQIRVQLQDRLQATNLLSQIVRLCRQPRPRTNTKNTRANTPAREEMSRSRTQPTNHQFNTST